MSSHWPALMDKPVGEDGYYMLTVADNIATTGRILYNRGAPATGIQPLATMLFAALDLVVRWCSGGPAALVRSVLGLGVVLHLLLAWQLSRISAALSRPAWRAQASALAFLFTLSSYTLFRLFTYGLETGLYLVVFAALFQITLRIAQRQKTGWRDMVLLGIAAGLAGEARIDFGLVFAILLAMLLFYRWISIGEALGAGLIALLIVSPWFLFVHHISGSWLPSSGKAESTMIAWHTLPARAGTMLQAVAGEVMPWCYATVSRVSVIVAILSALLVVVFAVKNQEYATAARHLLFSRHGKLWLACMLTLVGVYLVLFNATHFYHRYVAPLSIQLLPVCAVILSRSAWVRRHLVAVSGAMWVTFACWSAGALHTGHVSSSQTIAAGYIHKYYPQEHVGAFQSGVVGFFNRNVENLDGKLNQGALEAASRHQLPSFIDRQHIDVLVDWSSILHANLPAAYLQQEWEPCPVPIAGGGESICLVRKGTKLARRVLTLPKTIASPVRGTPVHSNAGLLQERL